MEKQIVSIPYEEDGLKKGNYGWYIVPFSIKYKKLDAFKSFVEKYERINRFENCQFLFSYIQQNFSNTIKSYRIPFDINGVSLDFGSVDNVDMNEVSLMQSELHIFSDYLGFLVFQISYGNLSVDEIRDFSYQFRRTSYTRFDRQNEHQSNLKDFVNLVLGNVNENRYVNPFFYSNNDFNSNCNVLQLVYYPEGIDDEETQNKNIMLIGRGYSKMFSADFNIEDSDVDMVYCPTSALEWRACQQCITAFVKKTDSHYDNDFPRSIKNNYLCLYLFLLNQRYSTIYLLEELIKTDSDDIKRMDDIEHMLDDVKIYCSFYAISNEMGYQNLYNRLFRVLDIEKLMMDVEDSSEKLRAIERKEDEKRERRMNDCLFAISILAVASVLIDFSDFIDKFIGLNTQNSGLRWIGIGISVIFVFAFVLVFLLKERKAKK